MSLWTKRFVFSILPSDKGSDGVSLLVNTVCGTWISWSVVGFFSGLRPCSHDCVHCPSSSLLFYGDAEKNFFAYEKLQWSGALTQWRRLGFSCLPLHSGRASFTVGLGYKSDSPPPPPKKKRKRQGGEPLMQEERPPCLLLSQLSLLFPVGRSCWGPGQELRNPKAPPWPMIRLISSSNEQYKITRLASSHLFPSQNSSCPPL